MNQYRCETCKNKGCYHHFSNWKGEIKKYKKSAHYAHGFTAEYGCASHSDFQSERDKVLDETSNGVVLWSPAHIFRLICRLDETELEYLLSDIRWLQERNFKRNHPELRQVNHEPVYHYRGKA